MEKLPRQKVADSILSENVLIHNPLNKEIENTPQRIKKKFKKYKVCILLLRRIKSVLHRRIFETDQWTKSPDLMIFGCTTTEIISSVLELTTTVQGALPII